MILWSQNSNIFIYRYRFRHLLIIETMYNNIIEYIKSLIYYFIYIYAILIYYHTQMPRNVSK